MASWHVDEGLARLISEWKAVHPGAVVYTIADRAHSTDPDVSQHAPDDGGSQPGDDKGEVDAGDFMPGKGGVTDADLDDLAEGLRRSKDSRLLYVIREQRIFSSRPVGGVAAWTWRPYKGKFHGHTHVSVDDDFDNNPSDWKWEGEVPVARELQWETFGVTMPILKAGDDDDDFPGYNRIARAQVLANLTDSSVPDIDADGLYGAETARKIAAVMKNDPKRSSSTGRVIAEPEWRRLAGLGG